MAIQTQKKLEGKNSNNLAPIVAHFKSKRLEELRTRIRFLKEKNDSLVICAITGVAGCGKSELAKAYAWQFSTEPNTFLWRLDPDPDSTNNNASKASYQQAFSQLLDNFNLQLKSDTSQRSEIFNRRQNDLLWSKIIQYDSWILIFDNAGSYIDIVDYLPTNSTAKGIVVITTQDSQFLTNNKEANFPLNKGLDVTEAIELLKELSHRASEDEASSRNLVQQLDYSPLGIRIAGGYIHNTDTMFNRYTRTLRLGTHEKLVQKMGGVGFINRVTQDKKRSTTLEMALQLSIKKVQASNALLIRALQYCAYLANEKIPLDLLIALCQAPGQNKLDVEDELITVIVGKGNYSLLTYHTRERSCYLHRTTQVQVRNLIYSPKEVINRIVNIIVLSYQYNEYSLQSIVMYQQIESHLSALNQHIASNPTSNTLIIQRLRLLLLLGQISWRLTKYLLALQCFQEAWSIIQKTPNCDLEIQIDILQHLGETRHSLFQYHQARTDLTHVVEMCGEDSKLYKLKLVRTYRILGDVIKDLDLPTEDPSMIYNKAIQLCQDVLLPTTDLELELSNVYRGVGQYLRKKRALRDAMTNYKTSLEKRQKCLGENHPHTAYAYQHLGTLGLYTDENKFISRGIDYQTSVKYVERSIEINSRVYGEECYYVAVSCHWLSRLLYLGDNEKNWESSLIYRNKEIKIHTQILGYSYQNIAQSYYWKGKILAKLGRNQESRNAFQEALTFEMYYQDKIHYWIQKSQDELNRSPILSR